MEFTSPARSSIAYTPSIFFPLTSSAYVCCRNFPNTYKVLLLVSLHSLPSLQTLMSVPQQMEDANTTVPTPKAVSTALVSKDTTSSAPLSALVRDLSLITFSPSLSLLSFSFTLSVLSLNKKPPSLTSCPIILNLPNAPTIQVLFYLHSNLTISVSLYSSLSVNDLLPY